MKTTKCVVALIIAILTCAPGLAQDRTVYMLRYFSPDTELVKVDLPSEPPFSMETVLIGQLGMGWVTSMAMSPSGELLALDSEENRLLEINIETGSASPFVNLDIDVGFR